MTVKSKSIASQSAQRLRPTNEPSYTSVESVAESKKKKQIAMIMKKIGVNADTYSRNEDEIKTVESFDGEKELLEEKERDKKRKVSAYKSLQFSKFEKDELLTNALENIP